MWELIENIYLTICFIVSLGVSAVTAFAFAASFINLLKESK